MINATIPTFRELAEDVLRMRDEQGIRGLSRERSRFRVHIEPAPFVDAPITDIARRDIREWLRSMAAKNAVVPAHKPAKKLDRHTINRAYSLVSVILAEAVERELIEVNPCLSVKQKKRVTESDTEEKWSYLKPDEQRAIVECPSIPMHEKLAIRFAYGTGLRQSEMTNLELADLHVDGSDPHVYVRYSVPLKGRKMPPKSGKKRAVPLLPDALDAARTWLDLLPKFSPKNPHNLVFPSPRGCYRQQGKPLGRSRSIHDVYRAAGIAARRGLHWHALRHTFASNLVSGMFGPKMARLEVIQVLMGHSSITITQRYAHLGEDAIAKAARETAAASAPADTVRTLPPDTIRDLNAAFDDGERHVA